MKLATKNRKNGMAAALIVAAVLLMAARFSGLAGVGSSSAAASQPTTVAAGSLADRPAKESATGALDRGVRKTDQWLDPTLRTDLLSSTEDIQYEGTGRNIFKVSAEPRKPEN